MPIDKTVCELFAGVGGFHLGLGKAGEWDVVWANQWEPSKTRQDAFECYKANFPSTTAVNIDIVIVNEDTDKYPIPKFNLLVGGFPCQDYSVASTGAKGIQGKKGVLWWEIEKILERKRPPFMLLENVDRLLKSPASQRGRDFGIILACLKNLGYGVEWRVINAADYGFVQRRRRVFIFAFHESTQYYTRATINAGAEIEERYIKNNGFFSEEFPIKEISEVKRAVLPLDRENFQESILKLQEEFTLKFGECGVLLGDNILTHRYTPVHEEPILLQDIIQGNVGEEFYLGDDLENWKYMKGSKRIERTSKTGHSYIFSEGAIAFPDPLDRPARTMLTSESSKNRSTHVIQDPETNRLRVLTPVECERINGFNDNWTNTGMSQKFRYFCMGNALVVGLVERMGRTLNTIFEQE